MQMLWLTRIYLRVAANENCKILLALPAQNWTHNAINRTRLWTPLALVVLVGACTLLAPDARKEQQLARLGEELTTLYQAGRFTEAESLAQHGVELTEQLFGRQHRHTATSITNLAFLLDSMGAFERAEPLYIRALKIQQRVLGLDHPITMRMFRYLFDFYVNTGAYSKAETLQERLAEGVDVPLAGPDAEHAEVIADLMSTPKGAAYVKTRRAYSSAWQAYLLGNYHQVVKLSDEILDISKSSGFRVGIVDGMYMIAKVYYKQGDYKRGLEILAQTLELAEVAGYKFGLGRIYSSIGSTHFRLGDYRSAKQNYFKSLEIRRQIGNEDEIARALNDIANVHQLLGAYWASLKLRQEAHILWQRTANRIGMADVLNDIGWIYDDLGDYEKALEFLERSLAIQEDLGERWGVADSTDGIALIKYKRGEYEAALEGFGKAYEEFAALGNQEEEIRVLNHHGQALFRLRRFDEAERDFELALSIAEKIFGAQHARTAASLANLAQIYTARYQYDRAESFLGRALAIYDKTDTPRQRIDALHNMGALRRQQGRLVDALGQYRQALALSEQLYTDLAGAPREARTTFFGQFSDLYRDYVDLLLELYQMDRTQRYDDEAFRAAERARSRTFFEMITETRAAHAFARSSGDPAFVELLNAKRNAVLRVHAMISRLREYERRSEAERDTTILNNIKAQLSLAEAVSLNIRNELAVRYPRYADLRNPKPLELQDTRQLLAPDEALLSYFVTERHIGIWGVTRETARLVVLDLGRTELAKRTEQLRYGFNFIVKTLASPPWNLTSDELRDAFAIYNPTTAHDLYKILIKPLADVLEGKSLVFVAPDDVLYQLPFDTLLTEAFRLGPPDPNTVGSGLESAPFFVRRFNLSYLPSVSVLRSLRSLGKISKERRKEFIAFADPVFETDADVEDLSLVARSSLLRRHRASGALRAARLAALPDTREEALYVARALGASIQEDVFLGVEASERNVKRLPLNRYRYLLFATHGLLAGEFRRGIQPALVLSFLGDPENDGFLEMGEILGLNLNADLVALSACNTAAGSGREDRGEGFAGLTRSFMYAGAKSLLVNQWSVESSTAKRLMQNVFTGMRTRNKARALADAKRAMFTKPEALRITGRLAVTTAHPFFWAPLILVGEGKIRQSK